MEVTPLVSPLSIGTVSYYDLLRRFPTPVKLAPPVVESVVDVEVYTPPPVEPNFAVDDLLDFSQEDDEPREEPESLTAATAPSFQTPASSSLGHTPLATMPSSVSHDCIETQSSDGLCVPPEELTEQLEWLSAFTEDSSYGGDRNLASLVSSGSLRSSNEEEASRSHDLFQTPSPVSVLEQSGGCYGASSSSNVGHVVPSRARSKRNRGTSRVWSLDSIIPTLLDNRLGGAQETPVFLGCSSNFSLEPVPKKQKKVSISTKSAALEAPPRRCTHCLVQKTPQWRAGPLGPKTLCNACGVRYKSGRLLPEYRPAGSPTFVSEVHSNSHKRILEMRRMKEAEEQQTQQELQPQQQLIEPQVNQHTVELDDGAEESDSHSNIHSCVEETHIDNNHSNDAESSHSMGNGDSAASSYSTAQLGFSTDMEESISSVN